MAFSRDALPDTLSGLFLSGMVAVAAIHLAGLPMLASTGTSPLIFAIFMGMAYANTLRSRMPVEWVPGVEFAAKKLLRLAIVLYGFKLTLPAIMALGWEVLAFDLAVIVSTLFLAWSVGHRYLKLDRDMCLLVGSGAGICGAAAVMATEGTLRSAPYKAVMAVGTVVAFGTLFMLLLPFAYAQGWLDLTERQYGILVGAVVHEVAQVVVAGDAAGQAAGEVAVMTKMGRVLLLAPVLLLLGFMLSRASASSDTPDAGKPPVPWFVILFVVMVGINSTGYVPKPVVDGLVLLDNFLLTMAMAALGIETTWAKLKRSGPCPFILATLLAVWLAVGGYLAVKTFF